MTSAGAPKRPRPRNPMPAFVRQALKARGLLDAYAARPSYQRNDYLGWIGRAARPATRQRRLEQMLDELKLGDVYMRMIWRSRHRQAPRSAKGGGAKKRPNR